MKTRQADNLELIGGEICLDFANTFTTGTESRGYEYLECYDDLVRWSHHTGFLSGKDADILCNLAEQQKNDASKVMKKAFSLRNSIFSIFSAIANRKAVPLEYIRTTNDFLAATMKYRRIAPLNGDFTWQWAFKTNALDMMLWPISFSAAQLLTGGKLNKVRQCARREHCDWLFMDNTKNRSRRWCSMELCGGRDKVNRYYRRKRVAKKISTSEPIL